MHISSEVLSGYFRTDYSMRSPRYVSLRASPSLALLDTPDGLCKQSLADAAESKPGLTPTSNNLYVPKKTVCKNFLHEIYSACHARPVSNTAAIFLIVCSFAFYHRDCQQGNYKGYWQNYQHRKPWIADVIHIVVENELALWVLLVLLE